MKGVLANTLLALISNEENLLCKVEKQVRWLHCSLPMTRKPLTLSNTYTSPLIRVKEKAVNFLS
jgi:hypothetical protein